MIFKLVGGFHSAVAVGKKTQKADAMLINHQHVSTIVMQVNMVIILADRPNLPGVESTKNVTGDT